MRHRVVLPSVLLAAALLAVSASPAAAAFYSSPTLPPSGADYAATGGAGCFTFAGVCVTPGTLGGMSALSDTFSSSGEDLTISATFSTALTTIGGAPLGPFDLTGTFEEMLLGRAGGTETGTWATTLLSADFTGTLFGHTVTLGLDSSEASSGTTSIVPTGNGFQISSFFDIFVDLSIDTVPPLTTTRGPLTLTLEPIPEPAGWALLALPLAGLLGGAARRRCAG